EQVRPGLRGANVRLEVRLDGSLGVRFQQYYLVVSECQPSPKPLLPSAKPVRRPQPPPPSQAWRQGQKNLADGHGLPVWLAARIDRTRTRDTLDWGRRSAGQKRPCDLRASAIQGLRSQPSPQHS